MQKQIVSILIMLFLLTGCAAMTDRQQTIFQGTALGAATGAAVGVIGTQIAGGDTEETLKGALIGLIAGGAGGALWGKHVADKKTEYKSNEKYLNACITAAKDAAKQSKEYNTRMLANIEMEKKRIDKLVAQYNKKEISTDKLKREKNRINNQIDQMQVDHDAILYQIAKFNKARSEAENEGSEALLAQLDGQIIALRNEAQTLNEGTTALASKSERIKI